MLKWHLSHTHTKKKKGSLHRGVGTGQTETPQVAIQVLREGWKEGGGQQSIVNGSGFTSNPICYRGLCTTLRDLILNRVQGKAWIFAIPPSPMPKTWQAFPSLPTAPRCPERIHRDSSYLLPSPQPPYEAIPLYHRHVYLCHLSSIILHRHLRLNQPQLAC